MSDNTTPTPPGSQADLAPRLEATLQRDLEALSATVLRMGAQLDVEGAESQRFTGRAIAALAADPDVLSRSGRALSSRELAQAYGVCEDDGTLPRDAAWSLPRS